jgi:hypothetical protein
VGDPLLQVGGSLGALVCRSQGRSGCQGGCAGARHRYTRGLEAGDGRYRRRHLDRGRQALQALGTCCTRALATTTSDCTVLFDATSVGSTSSHVWTSSSCGRSQVFVDARAPICYGQCRQAQRAPLRQPSPGGWLRFGHDHSASPSHGCVQASYPTPSPKFPHNSLPFAGHHWRTTSASSAGPGHLPKMNLP